MRTEEELAVPSMTVTSYEPPAQQPSRYDGCMNPRLEKGLATEAELESFDKGHEVIDGQIVQKALPSWAHSRAQLRFGRLLIPFDGPGGGANPGGWVFGSETIIELEAHQIYLPDVAGWRLEHAPDQNARIVYVPPDWVCELLSPSTSDNDLGPKKRAYHRARVGHYWIVEPEKQVLRVFRWQSNGYNLVLTAGPGDRVRAEPFDALELDLADLFGKGA